MIYRCAELLEKILFEFGKESSRTNEDGNEKADLLAWGLGAPRRLGPANKRENFVMGSGV